MVRASSAKVVFASPLSRWLRSSAARRLFVRALEEQMLGDRTLYGRLATRLLNSVAQALVDKPWADPTALETMSEVSGPDPMLAVLQAAMDAALPILRQIEPGEHEQFLALTTLLFELGQRGYELQPMTE